MGTGRARDILTFLRRKYVIEILYAIDIKPMTYTEIENNIITTTKLYELLALFQEYGFMKKIIEDERNVSVYSMTEKGRVVVRFINSIKHW